MTSDKVIRCPFSLDASSSGQRRDIVLEWIRLRYVYSNLPGERRKIEKIIKLNTAAMTRRAMKIPL